MENSITMKEGEKEIPVDRPCLQRRGLAFWGQAQLLLTPWLPGNCWRKGDGSWLGKALGLHTDLVLGHSSRGPSTGLAFSLCTSWHPQHGRGPTLSSEMLTHFLPRAEGNCADGSLRCRAPPGRFSTCCCLLGSCRSFQLTALCRVGPGTL